VGGKSENEVVKSVEAKGFVSIVRRFFPLASVSAGRPSVSAKRPRSGVVAQAVR
jgi:hypothetical protein